MQPDNANVTEIKISVPYLQLWLITDNYPSWMDENDDWARRMDELSAEIVPQHMASMNMTGNSCENINITRSDVAGFATGNTYSLVTANLITDVILSNISYFSEMMAENGRLIMSGTGNRKRSPGGA